MLPRRTPPRQCINPAFVIVGLKIFSAVAILFWIDFSPAGNTSSGSHLQINPILEQTTNANDLLESPPSSLSPSSPSVPDATAKIIPSSSISIRVNDSLVLSKSFKGEEELAAAPAATDLVWWTANPPTKCPQKLLTSDTNIPQSYKYADRVGMVTIAMQKQSMQQQITYLVQSIRRRGAWLGPIILIVDKKVGDDNLREKLNKELYGSDNDILKNHTNIHIVKISKKDITDLKRPAMKYKRFKTQLFDLLPLKLQESLEYLLYVDVDIVIGKPVVDFLDRALPLFSDNKNDDKTKNGSGGGGGAKWLFFEEQGKHPALSEARHRKWTLFHGGVFLVHREKSRTCLEEWQRRFDSDNFPNDQTALLNLIYGAETEDNEYEEQQIQQNVTTTFTAATSLISTQDHPDCRVGELPFGDLLMPRKGFLMEGRTRTFVHFTRVRVKRHEKYVPDYMKCTLFLDE